MSREFYIDTPIGKLHVWSKYEKDNENDFPGVYIDIMTDHGPEMLACVEYESMEKLIQTCVYYPGEDTPVHVVKYDMENIESE